ncbi:MAG: hypothetical protein GXO98_02755 [Nitrospirae bacterium]|nr:hypothetical protein [Nitrospirota bacterium]
MKFDFSFLKILIFVKEKPEKVISLFLLATFVFLGLYFIIGWSKRETSSPEEVVTIGRIKKERLAATKAAVAVDFDGLLVRKPITYYNDLIQRNPFSQLPKVAKLSSGSRKGIRTEGELIYRGVIGTPDGFIAFIEGRETYNVREGDEIEGWKVIKIEKDKVELYNKEKKKELMLPLGG